MLLDVDEISEDKKSPIKLSLDEVQNKAYGS